MNGCEGKRKENDEILASLLSEYWKKLMDYEEINEENYILLKIRFRK
jgi:hypothetical protein